MVKKNRREFIQQTSLGLAAVGTGLILRAGVAPTPVVASGEEGNRIMIQMASLPKAEITVTGELKKAAPLPYGPFYKQGAPFRGKLCPPGEPGMTFVLKGRVWAFDTKRPVPGVVLDFWHVDMAEKYSDGESDFRNRGRLVSSETGYYELESIRPIPYRPNPTGNADFWRCAHFHLLALCPGYKPLVTEIHFQDELRKSDPMYRPENAIAVEKRTVNGKSFETGTFDIVLERESK